MALPTLYRIGGALIMDAATRALIATGTATPAPGDGTASARAVTLDDGSPLTDEAGAAVTLD